MEFVSSRLEQILDGEIPVILPWASTLPHTEQFSNHIENLTIPTINNRPCILLHNIGQYVDSPDTQDSTEGSMSSIPGIKTSKTAYNPATSTARERAVSNIFLGPSTAHEVEHVGKSRIVLEGLCNNWGFYFTCGTNDFQLCNEIGSSDVRRVISDQQDGYLRAMGLKKTLEDNSDLSINEDCAQRCFQAVMCARLLVFTSYLKALVTRSDMMIDAKKIWMLIQVDTRLLARSSDMSGSTQSDIFLELTTLLCYAKPKEIALQNRLLFAACRHTIAGQVYCIIDEVQTATNRFQNAFRSGSGTGRPVLRPMLQVFTQHELKIIVTGTSLEHDTIIEALSSSLGKKAVLGKGVTATGSWMNEADIRIYLSYYLPDSYLKTRSGVELLERACYWLRGRGDLDFPYNSKIHDKELVETGFARYSGASEDDHAVFDEPLAYLAAEQWITSRGSDSEQRHAVFFRAIKQQNSAANGLEEYTALCIADIFKCPTELSQVFTFSDIGKYRGLASRKAQLVSCWYDKGGDFRVAEVFFPMHTPPNTHLRSPSSILGYNPTKKNPLNDLNWLRCQVNAPFLFPHRSFGPDLMFRLRLEDSGELITVALQVKWKPSRASVTGLIIDKAISSVTPAHFWTENTQKGRKPFAPDAFPDLTSNTINALDGLCKRFNRNEQGYHSLIRGVFFFPATPNPAVCDKVLLRLKKPVKDLAFDRDSVHEFFVLPSSTVKKTTQIYPPRSALQQLESATARRLHETGVGEEDRRRAARKKDRELHELWDSFEDWD
ncbi:hypothetical protein C0993_004557, partial [Termitomyces sp. T159_Od127]